jgi:hypothetical protein
MEVGARFTNINKRYDSSSARLRYGGKFPKTDYNYHNIVVFIF